MKSEPDAKMWHPNKLQATVICVAGLGATGMAFAAESVVLAVVLVLVDTALVVWALELHRRSEPARAAAAAERVAKRYADLIAGMPPERAANPVFIEWAKAMANQEPPGWKENVKVITFVGFVFILSGFVLWRGWTGLVLLRPLIAAHEALADKISIAFLSLVVICALCSYLWNLWNTERAKAWRAIWTLLGIATIGIVIRLGIAPYNPELAYYIAVAYLLGLFLWLLIIGIQESIRKRRTSATAKQGSSWKG